MHCFPDGRDEMFPIVNDVCSAERNTERLESVPRVPEQFLPSAGMGIDDKYGFARDRFAFHPTQVVEAAENSSFAHRDIGRDANKSGLPAIRS